ncbi:hypothetical protein [Halegenticoccus tardaugens]|uniref:hypothetical protein n=1 Tax=Halegenticoccus tardaugens TaxID=2071624 RepID=UPI00100A813D|nr:hypothetical protein [Halegenticoccus tardaugens]
METDALPVGWTQTPLRGDEVAARHESDRITLLAEKVRSPSLTGVSEPRWKIQLVHRLENDYTAGRPLGYAITDEAAEKALVASMEIVNDALSESDREVLPSLNAIVTRIEKRNEHLHVPEEDADSPLLGTRESTGRRR